MASIDPRSQLRAGFVGRDEAVARFGAGVPHRVIEPLRVDDYLRARRDQWAVDGLARKDGRRWFYRRAIVPRSRLSGIQRAEAAMERAG